MRGYVSRRVTSTGLARYAARVDGGRDPRTGKRLQPSRTFEKERDAWRWVRDQIKAMEEGRYVSRRRATLREYLTTEWLPMVTPTLKASTADSYRRTVDLHVVPHLGGLDLQQIRPSDLAKWTSGLAEKGRLNGPGGGLSPKSVVNTFRILSKALSDAVDLGYIAVNPAASRAARPRVRVGRVGSKVEAWTESQLREFLGATQVSQYWPAWHLAAYTGMRRAEVLGLRWRDVDFSKNRLHVRATVVLAGYQQVVQDEGKTDNAARVIDLDPDTVDVLRAHRKSQAEILLVLGVGRSEYVFCREDGTHLNPDSFSQAFDRAVARLVPRVPRLPLQGLRHTHATILLKAGVPVKVVSERLGHFSADADLSRSVA